MSGPSLSSRQLALAAASADAAARALAVAEDRQGKPPAAGDRFLLRATTDLPVEWVLLEKHAEQPVFLAVPADTQPLAGGGDLELPPDSAAGALCLRCAFPVWLEAGRLEPELRAGAVDAVALARARQKVRDLGAGALPEATEVDGSPAYGDWIRETIAPALAAAGKPGVAPVTSAPARVRWRPSMALAAALAALLLAAAFAGGAWRQLGRLTERARAAEAALSEERAIRAREVAAAEKAAGLRLAGPIAAQKAREQHLLARIAERERSEPALLEAMLNVPVAVLYPADLLRGETKPHRVARQSPYFVAVLRVEEPASHPSYRVVLTRQGKPAPVWQSDGLGLANGEVSLALPGSLLTPGAYHFELFGLAGGKAERLTGYDLTIAR